MQSVLASLELINEVLSAKQAKPKLTANVDELHATVDAVYLWLMMLLYSLVSELHLPPGTVHLSNSAITAISAMGVNLFELTAGPAVQFPSGEGMAMHMYLTYRYKYRRSACVLWVGSLMQRQTL